MVNPFSGSCKGPGRLSFSRFARWTERQVGTPISFAIAVAIVVLWAGSGPFFGWSDTWQLVINTGTTIVTFLMVFLIQSTQSRDTQALHLKLDELIRVDNAARNSLLNLEEMSEADIEQVKTTFRRLIGPSEATAVREACDPRASGIADAWPEARLGDDANRCWCAWPCERTGARRRRWRPRPLRRGVLLANHCSTALRAAPRRGNAAYRPACRPGAAGCRHPARPLGPGSTLAGAAVRAVSAKPGTEGHDRCGGAARYSAVTAAHRHGNRSFGLPAFAPSRVQRIDRGDSGSVSMRRNPRRVAPSIDAARSGEAADHHPFSRHGLIDLLSKDRGDGGARSRLPAPHGRAGDRLIGD